MKNDRVFTLAAGIILLAVDWLAFHDLMEPHTVRDWLTLLASALVFIQLGRTLWAERGQSAWRSIPTDRRSLPGMRSTHR